MKKKYRIVPDDYNGFEVQAWRWYFPFWIQCNGNGGMTNTHTSLEKAKEFIKKKKNSATILYQE